MPEALQKYYGSDYLAMATDLGMAAVPLKGLNTDSTFLAPVERIAETGVYYGGGTLPIPHQLHNRPSRIGARRSRRFLAQRRRIAAAGRLCWLVVPWCFSQRRHFDGLGNIWLWTASIARNLSARRWRGWKRQSAGDRRGRGQGAARFRPLRRRLRLLRRATMLAPRCCASSAMRRPSRTSTRSARWNSRGPPQRRQAR